VLLKRTVLKNILKPLLEVGTHYCWFLVFTAFHEKYASLKKKKLKIA